MYDLKAMNVRNDEIIDDDATKVKVEETSDVSDEGMDTQFFWFQELVHNEEVEWRFARSRRGPDDEVIGQSADESICRSDSLQRSRRLWELMRQR